MESAHIKKVLCYATDECCTCHLHALFMNIYDALVHYYKQWGNWPNLKQKVHAYRCFVILRYVFYVDDRY